MGMIAVAERRAPSADELALRGQLGRRRAVQGIPIDALLQSYHVGYRELWREFVSVARSRSDKAAELLPEAAMVVWGWIHEVTGAVTDAYTAMAHAEEAYAAGLRQQFIEMLVTGEGATTELAELAAALSFDPAGEFHAVATSNGALDTVPATRLVGELRLNTGRAVDLFRRGSEVVIVSQAVDPARTVALIERALGDTAVGSSGCRRGLGGARLAVADARAALTVAGRQGGTCRFDDEWFAALLLRHADQLEGVLQSGLELARANPHLADAVAGFCAAGFSLAGAGKAMSLHPNSVAYRLDRWQELCGWDPRELQGALKSLAAIELARP